MDFSHKNMLPGILNKEVEFFAVGDKKVRAFHDSDLYKNFCDLPEYIFTIIRSQMNRPDADMLEMEEYVFDHFGGLDREADIDEAGNVCCTEYMESHDRVELSNGQSITHSELRVLKLALLPDKIIADQLFISTTTVLSHWQNMRHKTGLGGKVELAVLATKKGII